MKTLESLGFVTDTSRSFCPSIEYAEFVNGERKIIFWKDKSISIYMNEEGVNLSFDEVQACVEMINRMGW